MASVLECQTSISVMPLSRIMSWYHRYMSDDDGSPKMIVPGVIRLCNAYLMCRIPIDAKHSPVPTKDMQFSDFYFSSYRKKFIEN